MNLQIPSPAAKRKTTVRFEASPILEIQTVKLEDKNFHVVRDDVLVGGTKQRGLFGLLQGLKNQGIRRVAYASPFCGYAQIALAYLCDEMNLQCILFCEKDQTLTDHESLADERNAHAYTLKAERMGAYVQLFDSLGEAHASLKKVCHEDLSIFEIPLGFDCPEFTQAYTAALKKQWGLLLEKLDRQPDTLWLPVGSGTLVRNFAKVLENSPVRICAVNVHVLPDNDFRITCFQNSEKISLMSAPQCFREPAKTLPPFPSNPFYDAKLAPFVAKLGRDGDVWWNVAR